MEDVFRPKNENMGSPATC